VRPVYLVKRWDSLGGKVELHTGDQPIVVELEDGTHVEVIADGDRFRVTVGPKLGRQLLVKELVANRLQISMELTQE